MKSSGTWTYPNFYILKMIYAEEPKDKKATIKNIEACIADIKDWMTNNMLKINDDKTEVIVFGTRMKLSQLGDIGIKIGESIIKPSQSVRNLGVVYDPCLSMEPHISTVCKAAYYNIRRISHVRDILTEEATRSLVQAMVTSRLDYGNGLLIGLPRTVLNRLQRAQNTAARLITRIPRSDHITPVLENLHWLPVHQRIQFKILLHVYKCLNSRAPSYLSELLNYYTPPRALRSQNKCHLVEPTARLANYGDRAFQVCAPKLWNQLPLYIRQAATVDAFKRLLKTHIFRQTYSRF